MSRRVVSLAFLVDQRYGDVIDSLDDPLTDFVQNIDFSAPAAPVARIVPWFAVPEGEHLPLLVETITRDFEHPCN